MVKRERQKRRGELEEREGKKERKSWHEKERERKKEGGEKA